LTEEGALSEKFIESFRSFASSIKKEMSLLTHTELNGVQPEEVWHRDFLEFKKFKMLEIFLFCGHFSLISMIFFNENNKMT
jgi:hypothetical protein